MYCCEAVVVVFCCLPWLNVFLQVDDYRAKSLVKKNSGTIYRTLKKESLKYSMGKSGSKSFNEQDEDEDDDMLWTE